MNETFAAGDNFNDLPMLNLAFARFLACPSNAIEDVKATVRNQGGFVAAQDSGFGVDEALRYFFPEPSLSASQPQAHRSTSDRLMLPVSCLRLNFT